MTLGARVERLERDVDGLRRASRGNDGAKKRRRAQTTTRPPRCDRQVSSLLACRWISHFLLTFAMTAPMRPPLPTPTLHARRVDGAMLTAPAMNGAPEAPPTMCGSTPEALHGAAATRAATLLRTDAARS